jgi:hypothetical protein
VILGGGAIHKDWWHNSIPSYRPDKASGMMAYLIIDRALGTGGSYFVSIDWTSKFAAALMLSWRHSDFVATELGSLWWLWFCRLCSWLIPRHQRCFAWTGWTVGVCMVFVSLWQLMSNHGEYCYSYDWVVNIIAKGVIIFFKRVQWNLSERTPVVCGHSSITDDF